MCMAKQFMPFFPIGAHIQQETVIGMSEEPNVSVVLGEAIDIARYGNNQSDVNSEQAFVRVVEGDE